MKVKVIKLQVEMRNLVSVLQIYSSISDFLNNQLLQTI